MPNRKNNTTLVTEDQLVEVVSARVTGQIKQDIDERFGRFEQMLAKLAPRDDQTEGPPEHARKRPAEDDQDSVRPLTKAPRQTVDLTEHGLSNSSLGSFSGDALDFPPRHLSAADKPRRTAHAPGLQEARASSGVNINNNNSTWAAWLDAQQPFTSHSPATTGCSGYDSTSMAPADLDAQVRHILDVTPHSFKGNVPVGIYPFKQVTRGPEKRKLSFNTVSLAEHIYGMFRILDDVNTSSAIKPHIITHMREVAEDACEFEWNGYVRRWSEEVFNLVAENRLPGGWGATARIQNLRTGMSRVDAARLNFSKEVPHTKKPATYTHHQQADNLRGGPPCTAFNSAQGCTSQSGHVLAGKRQIHVCSYCLLNNAAAHPHSEALCRNKQRNTASHFQ